MVQENSNWIVCQELPVLAKGHSLANDAEDLFWKYSSRQVVCFCAGNVPLPSTVSETPNTDDSQLNPTD